MGKQLPIGAGSLRTIDIVLTGLKAAHHTFPYLPPNVCLGTLCPQVWVQIPFPVDCRVKLLLEVGIEPLGHVKLLSAACSHLVSRKPTLAGPPACWGASNGFPPRPQGTAARVVTGLELETEFF